jgi:hypothetical protein
MSVHVTEATFVEAKWKLCYLVFREDASDYPKPVAVTVKSVTCGICRASRTGLLMDVAIRNLFCPLCSRVTRHPMFSFVSASTSAGDGSQPEPAQSNVESMLAQIMQLFSSRSVISCSAICPAELTLL